MALSLSAAAQASRAPTRAQLLAATMPSYKPAAGTRQECLGRLVWDVEGSIAWPGKFNRNAATPFDHIFSDNVFDAGDEIHFGNTSIAVTALDARVRDDVLGSLPGNRLAAMSKELVEAEASFGKMKSLQKGNVRERNRYEIAETRIDSIRKTLQRLKQDYQPFSPGLADSMGYAAIEAAASNDNDRYSIYTAYLFRKDVVYTFESREKITPALTVEKHRQQFVALLAGFRPRQPYEIPREPGVCIPRGFLPDDGRTVTDIKQSLRWADAPGVLYSIQTGTVRENQLKSTLLTAASRAAVGTLGTADEEQVRQLVDQRIGPRQARIGDLVGEQGGVALKIAAPDRQPYETYSVFTGYAGWLGADALPFILVDMRSHTRSQAPELPADPPPFRRSMDRLDGLLKTLRLRPTAPALPELR